MIVQERQGDDCYRLFHRYDMIRNLYHLKIPLQDYSRLFETHCIQERQGGAYHRLFHPILMSLKKSKKHCKELYLCPCRKIGKQNYTSLKMILPH